MKNFAKRGAVLAIAISMFALLSLVTIPSLDPHPAQAQQFGNSLSHSDTPTVGHGRPLVVSHQSEEVASTKLEVARDTFRRSLIVAARTAAEKGTITKRDVIKIRIASFSPSFLERAEELCVVQMAFSEDADLLPYTEVGEIDRTAIDWEGLAGFLERIIPLILALFKAFGI